MLPSTSPMGEGNNCPEDPRRWRGHFPKLSNSARRQARESTPDADDERYAWNPHGPDPQEDTELDNPRTNVQTHHNHKMDSPLISDHELTRVPSDHLTTQPGHPATIQRLTRTHPEDALERLKGRRERSHGMRPGASRMLLHPTYSATYLLDVSLTGRMRIHAC